MGPAIELLTGFTTGVTASGDSIVMASGNSLTIRHTREDSEIRLLQTWADFKDAVGYRIRSPLLHDNVQGIRLQPVVGEVDPLLPYDKHQPLITQDTLSVEVLGIATANYINTVCLLVFYEDLPGVEGRFISPIEVKSRLKHILTVENTLSLGTSGGYSGEEVLNAEFDLLKGNTDYCLIGYHVSAECACIRYRSVDWGSLGVGGPGNDTDKQITGNWFERISELTEKDFIPVFNSANIDSIYIDGAQEEGGTDVTVTTILGELRP